MFNVSIGVLNYYSDSKIKNILSLLGSILGIVCTIMLIKTGIAWYWIGVILGFVRINKNNI